MSAAVRNRSPVRHSSDSPRRRHLSPGRRSPPYNERSPDRRRTSMKEKSPARNRGQRRSASPAREKFNDRAIRSSRDMHDRSPRREKELDGLRSGRHRQSRSPVREKQPQRGRSPISMRPKSPIPTASSPPPSPRTKRLRRAEAEREAEKWVGSEHSRVVVREKHREHREHKDASEEGKSVVLHDRNDGKSSKSTKPGHSVSPNERNRHRRRSPDSPSKAPSSRERARDEVSNSRAAERPREHVDDSISKMKAAEDALEAKQKQKPSFELSGKLAEETNRVRGVTLLFTEPPDARKPDVRWRLYVFKAGEVLNEPLYLHRQSSYLFGRERRVADVPTDHPSCSKQHAVIQYRLVEKDLPDGLLKKQVRPYLMDLGSTNGTFINDNRIEPQRYYELVEKDTIRFGNSSREYVLLHENSVQ